MTTWLGWAYRRVGYWIRPYDMLADRRRWFWQPRQGCQSLSLDDPRWRELAPGLFGVNHLTYDEWPEHSAVLPEEKP